MSLIDRSKKLSSFDDLNNFLDEATGKKLSVDQVINFVAWMYQLNFLNQNDNYGMVIEITKGIKIDREYIETKWLKDVFDDFTTLEQSYDMLDHMVKSWREWVTV